MIVTWLENGPLHICPVSSPVFFFFFFRRPLRCWPVFDIDSPPYPHIFYNESHTVWPGGRGVSRGTLPRFLSLPADVADAA